MNINHRLLDFRNWLILGICLLFSLVWSFVPHPALIIVLCILPIGILITLRIPYMMVLFFVIFSFFRIHEVIPQLYNFKIPLLLSLASIFALAWHIGISKQIKPYWRDEMKPIVIFYFLVFIGIFFASNMAVAIEHFKNIYSKIALMSFAIIWLIRETKEFSFASRAIVIAGTIVAIKALFNQANGIGMVEETRVTIGRDLGSVLGDPNDLSLALMFPLAFAVSFVVTKNIDKTTKLISLSAIGLLFMAVLATQSRGGLLGVMAVFGLFAYRRIKSKVLFFGLGGVAAILLYAVAGISDRASGGAAEDGIDASSMGRLYAWEAAFYMALSNPLTGVGLDNFYYNYFYFSQHWDGKNHAVHSTWFGVLGETGFLGFIVFIIMVVTLVKLGLKTMLKLQEHKAHAPPSMVAVSEGLVFGLIGTLVSGTFLTFGFVWPIYILAALIIATATWADNNLKDVDPISGRPNNAN
jgi:probable O-glycosylation ligase (exosortase A-associated)